MQWQHALQDTTRKALMTAGINMSGIALQADNLEEALRYLNIALDVAAENKNVYTIQYLKKRTAELYANAQSYKQAYDSYVNFYNFQDSIAKKQNSLKIAELEKKYEFQKKEASIAKLEKDKAERNIIIYLILGFLVMLIAVSFVLWRNIQIKKRSNQKLQSKNLELANSFESIKEQNHQIEAQKDRIALLLKEIHHRTKNNLQLISSLLNLQMAEIDHPLVFEAMLKNRNQLNSMTLIHQKLYRDEDLSFIFMKDYLMALSDEIRNAFGSKAVNVKISCDFDDVSLDVDTAVPVGLIVNELITNSLKHGFSDGESGQIEISLKRVDEVQYVLSVSDDGVGKSRSANVNNEKQGGFGTRLVSLLTLHLGGELDMVSSRGTKVEIRFKSLKPKYDGVAENVDS